MMKFPYRDLIQPEQRPDNLQNGKNQIKTKTKNKLAFYFATLPDEVSTEFPLKRPDKATSTLRPAKIRPGKNDKTTPPIVRDDVEVYY